MKDTQDDGAGMCREPGGGDKEQQLPVSVVAIEICARRAPPGEHMEHQGHNDQAADGSRSQHSATATDAQRSTDDYWRPRTVIQKLFSNSVQEIPSSAPISGRQPHFMVSSLAFLRPNA